MIRKYKKIFLFQDSLKLSFGTIPGEWWKKLVWSPTRGNDLANIVEFQECIDCEGKLLDNITFKTKWGQEQIKVINIVFS